MSEVAQRNFSDSAGAEGGGNASPRGGVYLGQPNIGRFVVTNVAQTPARRESHVPGLLIVPYRVTLQVKEALPPLTEKVFVISGSKGEGPEAGALGLQDWLPTTVGEECVLAFDPQRIENAERVVYLGGGADVEPVWQSAKRFHGLLRSETGLDPSQFVVALKNAPLPRSIFFQLVFDYDKNVYKSSTVTRALGAYLANSEVPVLDRRTTVAHYLGQPTENPKALREFAKGLLQLALHLADAGQASSAGVVFQRVYGFCFDPKTNTARIDAPDFNDSQHSALENLLSASDVSLNPVIAQSLRKWLNS